MEKGDGKYQITKQLIYNLRRRLLDTGKNNPLINFHFSERSRTHIRVINEFPDSLYSKLIERKTLTFASLPQIQQIPSDEQTDTFRIALQAARFSDTDEHYKTNELEAITNLNVTGEQQLEQELREQVRRQLGLPPRSKKEQISVVECAKQMGINPSFELPLPDKESGKFAVDLGNTIQTLLFPDLMDRKLSGLFNQIRIGLSEMGVNTLYCAWGFLEWFESDDSDIPLFAPLVLLQLEMRQTLVRQTYRYSVESTGDDVEINVTLKERLRQDFGMELPLFEETDTTESYFAKVSEMIEGKRRWRVRRFVTIGKLSFSRLVMYQDLDPSRWPANRPLEKHKVLSDLLGGIEHDVTTEAEEYLVDDKNISAIVPILITNADSSQFSAIVDAMKGKNLAIQGPPGTGKSQTITNIIAVALYLKKSVLFLSEKMAALEVVKKRLDDAGIGDFCLELHSTKAQKQHALDSLKKRLSYHPGYSPNYHLPMKEEQQRLQDQLNEYAIRLNQLWGRTGKTINEIIWSEQRAREAVAGYKPPDNIRQLEDKSANGMTLVNLDERLSKLRIAEEAYCLIIRKYGSLAKHPWYGIDGASMSIFDQESIILELSNWLSKIEQIAEAAHRMSQLIKISENDLTIESVKDLLSTLRESEYLGQSDIDSSIICNLRDQPTVDAVDKLILDCQSYCAKYDELRNYATDPEKLLAREIPQANQLLNFVSKFAIHETVDSLTISEIKTLSDNLKLTLLKLRNCSLLVNKWRNLIGYTDYLTVAEIQTLISAIQIQISTSQEVMIRRTKELTDEMSADILERGKKFVSNVITKQTELENRFNIKIDDSPERLRQLSNSIGSSGGLLDRFSTSYRNAIKGYLLLLKPNTPKPKPMQMASDLNAIADLIEEIHRLNDDAQLRQVVGPDYRGLATDFKMQLAVNEYGTRVCRIFNTNTKLGKRIRQYLLEESIEILDAVKAMAKELDIDEFKHYIDPYVSRDPNKDLDGICRDYEEAIVVANNLYSTLSDMTVKEHVSIQEITKNLSIKIQELYHINSIISENAIAKMALSDHFKGPNSITELICSTNSRAKSILKAKLPSAFINELLSTEHNLIRLKLSSITQEIESLLSQEIEIRNTVLETQKVDLCLFLGNEPVEKIAIAGVQERLHKSVDNPKEFPEWANYCQVRQEAIDLGLGKIVDIYLQPRELSTTLHLAEVYEWVFYRSLIKSFLTDFPQFRQFSGLTHESLRQRYAKLDRETIKLQQRALVLELAANHIKAGIGSGYRSSWTNLALLENEIRKKKRHVALRDLLMRAGEAILAMKPCFMMSPASVAQFIRPDSNIEFDIVIIDEASQMKPEEALGAIARGKQLIVVGDPKQLPPTAFFDRTDFPDDDAETNTEDYIDTESILDLSLSTFRPSRNLIWHYRSRHESLIAFSNKAFYDGSLTVFPCSKIKHQDLGVEYRFVKGVYRGRTNIVEAQEVIAVAREYMYKYPNRSLGIVTMNIPQMEILNAELEMLFSHDRRCYEYRVKWESTLEPLFAKNLENVQGDERDIIFISTLYGPNETGKVMQRFGPVNSSAGARRLNVLFTRAKEKVIVFSSMKSTDLIPTEASQEGVGVLKTYLEYARTGQLESGKQSDREPASDFEISVGEKLRQCGYEVVPQVGVAGYFIDLAVKNPNNLDSYVLGIECDGRVYHSAKSARDRDRLRQEVLEGMGWKIHRIWSLDWFQDSEGQMKRLLDRLQELCVVTSSVIDPDSDKQELQTNSVAIQPEVDDGDTSEVPTLTPDTNRIDLNITKSSPKYEVNESNPPLKLIEEDTSLEYILKKERETPGTWRYKEAKDERPLTIYLTKEEVNKLGDPQSIKVVITAV